MNPLALHLGALTLSLSLVACQKANEATPAPSAAPGAPEAADTHAPVAAPPPGDPAEVTVPGEAIAGWVGHWVGPEGTLLDVAQVGQKYSIRIQSLDGPASYEGKVVGDHLEFIRDGKTESLRTTDGAGTGMKWLADKKNCLVIQASEGFCRD